MRLETSLGRSNSEDFHAAVLEVFQTQQRSGEVAADAELGMPLPGKGVQLSPNKM